MVVLTLLEALALSFAVDIQPLAVRSGLASVVGAGGGIVALLFIGPVVLAVLQDAKLHALLSKLSQAEVPAARAATAWAAHLAAFGLFAWSTHALVNAPAPTDLQVAGWLLAAPAVPAVALVIGRPGVDVGPLLRSAGPALLLGATLSVFVWSMGNVAQRLWGWLYPVVLTPVHAVLQATVTDVVYEPERFNVGTERFLVNVSPVCSGLEGLGLLVSLAAIAAYQRRATWPWTYVISLLAGAALLSWVANVVRISLLVVIGDAGYDEVAIGGFHSKAGWVLYTSVGLAMMVFVARADATDAAPDTTGQTGSTGDAALTAGLHSGVGAEHFIGPVLAFTITGLLTGLFAATTFDPLYGSRALVGGIALFIVLRQLSPTDLADETKAGTPLAAVGFGVLAFGVWWWVAPGPVTDPLVRGLTALPTASAVVWVGARIVGAVIVVPWVEELAFRGYLLRRFGGADFMAVPYGHFRILPVLGAALAFGAVHQAVVGGALVGILYAAAQAHGRRLRDAVIAHATTNALVVAQALIEWPS